ncbi:hypothetical protein PENSPDRAFT_579192, partial [Peniophora sp. CONT]
SALQKTVHDHEDLLTTIAKVDYKRTAALLNSTFLSDRSIAYTIEKLNDAALGKYKPRNYTELELDLAIIVKSNRNTYALNQAGGLPSRRTVDNYARKVHIEPQIGDVTAADLERAIEIGFLAPRREQFKASGAAMPTRKRGHIEKDESQVEDCPRLGHLPGEKCAVAGFCVECTPREALMLSPSGFASVEDLAEQYRLGKYHLAREVTLAGIAVAGEPGLVPILVAPTCKSQEKRTTADLFRLFIEVYENNTELQQYIELEAISTDGDPACRKATHEVLYSVPVVPGNALWPVMSQCGGWHRRVGPHNMTADPDWRHVLPKRNILTCIRTGTGMLINKTVFVGTGLLSRKLPLVPGLTHQHVAILLNPDDAMNVPAADELLRAIIAFSKLPDSTFGHITASECAEIDALRFLGQLLESVLNIFLNVDCSLSDQILHTSKAAHLMFTLYRCSRTDALNNELYHDAQSLFHHLPTMVVRQANLDGSVDVCLPTECGSDNVEDLFGEVHVQAKHRHNPDYIQFIHYVTNGVQRLEAYRRHPELKPPSDRRAIKSVKDDDYIRKRHWRAVLRADSCDVASSWKKGADAAAETCRIFGTNIPVADYDYPTLWASPEDIDLQHPFGNGLKPGISQTDSSPSSAQPAEDGDDPALLVELVDDVDDSVSDAGSAEDILEGSNLDPSSTPSTSGSSVSSQTEHHDLEEASCFLTD